MLPKVFFVIMRCDTVEGMYCPKYNRILLDCINEQSFFNRIKCLAHELCHAIFNMLPEQLYTFFSRLLDITDGNDPDLLFNKTCNSDTTVIFLFR